MLHMYEMSSSERGELGKKGRTHVLKNYNFDDFSKRWDEIFTMLHAECGSWETRRGYQRWVLKEIK